MKSNIISSVANPMLDWLFVIGFLALEVIYLVYAYLHPADVHKDMRRMRGKG